MDNHDNFALKDMETFPTDEVLKQTLGESYNAYETLQEALPTLELEQEWQWYKPRKAWFAKGQFFWTTKRGTKKEKTLYWLYVHEGYFIVAVWFKEKDREELLHLASSENIQQLIQNAETTANLPTFPVMLLVKDSSRLEEFSTLIQLKKKIEL